MALNSILVSFFLHLGVMLPVAMASKVNTVAGETIVLPCPQHSKARNPDKVIWKYKGESIIQYTQGKLFKGDRSAKYTFVDPDKGNFSLSLPDGKEGQYTCEVEGKETLSYDLQVWNVKKPQSGYHLQGEPLLLGVDSSGKEHIVSRIEWLSPNRAKVTGNEPRWKLENNNWSLRIKNLTVQEDDGIWECHIHPNGPKIHYDVKVIGFLHPLGGNDMKFVAINSSVTLSCPLNVALPKEKNTENFPKLQSWELIKDNKIIVKENLSNNANSTFPAKVISKVQFEDAGRYQCRFTFAKGYLNKSIHLIVMKVSASSLGLYPENANVSLCCHISAAVPAVAELCWVHMNVTRCQSHLQKSTFCQESTTVGLWRCDLKVKNSVMISINYTVEEDTVKNISPLVEVLSGVGVMLLLLIFAGLCVFAFKPIKQKRQRAWRMAQAKQHLLEKKTCQCERELTNDYYHA